MKIQKRQIAGMNLVYKFYSFDYFLDAMERLGYESIELLPTHLISMYQTFLQAICLPFARRFTTIT